MKTTNICLVFTLSLAWIGCGPSIERVDISSGGPGGSSSEGGAGGAGTGGVGVGGAGAGGSGGGENVVCGSLEARPITFALTAIAQQSPRIATDPTSGHVLYSFMNAKPDMKGSLYTMDVDAFDNWPPNWTPAKETDTEVSSYALGNSPSGPIALIRHAQKPPVLAHTLTPNLGVFDVPITDNGTPLFVTAIPKRYFWAQTLGINAYDVLHFGSYEPNSLPQSDQPVVCLQAQHRAYAVPSGNGFLAAYLEGDAPDASCTPGNTGYGSVIGVSRYSVPDGAGAALVRKPGSHLLIGEPVLNLGLAGTSFGAWLVMQSDGSTALIPPPLMAARLNTQGIVTDTDGYVQLSDSGFITPALATTSLGDTLAAAYVDNIDPSAPVIIVRLVDSSKQFQGSISIPTNDAWFTGDLQLVGSNDHHSLLVAWTANNVTAFVRIDCLP